MPTEIEMVTLERSPAQGFSCALFKHRTATLDYGSYLRAFAISPKAGSLPSDSPFCDEK